MTIALTDEHRELAGVAASFLASVGARAQTRVLLDAPRDAPPAFWGALAELGWLGLHVEEEYGGAGAGLAELVVVLEALGRAVAPGPFLPTVIASAVIGACAAPAERAALLPGLVDGSVVAGVGFGGSAQVAGEVVTGDAGVVLGAPGASILVVPAGADILVVARGAVGVVVSTERNLDPSRPCGRVRFEDVARADVTVLPGAAATALAHARTLAAAEAAGGARDCVDMAAGYAKLRRQFGRVIGTFGPVKHHCANMAVAAELATAAGWNAARAAAEDAEQFALAGAAAAALALPAYQRNAQLNIQVHGGIGFTWEHDAHLHLRRAAVLSALVSPASSAQEVTTLAESGVTRRYTLNLPPEAEVLRGEIRDLAAEISAVDPAEQPHRLIDAGLAMPHWPRPWGRGAKAVEQLVIDEELARVGLRRPQLAISGWILMTLIQHGTEEQVDRWIRPSLHGQVTWCQLFSEPDAGSDAAAVRTRAHRVEGGWLVTGQKVWTTGAQHARFGLATVRTSPDAPKHAGISAMVIDMAAKGIEVRPLREAIGSALFNEVFFDDVFVPDSDVVGAVDGGWRVARSTIGNERVTIGGGDGLAIGIDPLRAWQGRAVDLPGGRVRVGELLAEAQAIRALNLRRAQRAVLGAEAGPEGNITKLVSAEHGQRSLDLAMDLQGPQAALAAGVAGEISGLYIFARQNTIAGGTSEISRNQIGERILGLPRDPLTA
ncbi:acyl-CoA dehydrogenase [Frankia sp. AgB32]|uniref:acyl-CoA dehydrogenase n=1 Tax=Frankia sp. AgB32 TaxID=631119 RepID=UPI00200C06A2|nr:acyl-CoA dehydrogenase [Frankia sp. AgB32]MCK9894487.1 acyl-CoA dehydrogenase [Frankia sp. AgB32]